MQATSHQFHKNVRAALANENLQHALKGMETGLATKRRQAVAKIPQFEDLRRQGEKIKQHSLANLDVYLEQFMENAEKQGAEILFARDGARANELILSIIEEEKANFIAKSKSMVSEEIALNHALEQAGHKVLETDLGEYIVQLRKEYPSHLIAPAIHVLKSEVESLFKEKHDALDKTRQFPHAADLVAEARKILRSQFNQADIGITGANFLIAQTGQSVVVTNEGNADLTQHAPKTHIVLVGIEKIIPDLNALAVMLRLLARSASGQVMTSYVTLSLGAKRTYDKDGPERLVYVIVDNGRSRMLGNQFRPMLQCIRCSACLNNCPVYGSIGGHAYGWVYQGPMGSVLTPNFIGLNVAHDLPQASSLCGKCAEVCPVKIPLPDLLRQWRMEEHKQQISPPAGRIMLSLWAWLAARPALYHVISKRINWAMRQSYLRPFITMGAKSWMRHRALPLPLTPSFLAHYRKRQS